MEIINSLDLSIYQWAGVIAAAFLVGFSKTGITVFFMITIPILASVFGGKESTGVILPMMLVGDVIAVWYYNRHADWGNIKRLLPWVAVGLLLGIVVGRYIGDRQFKMLIAISVLVCLGIMVYTHIKGGDIKVPEGTWFYAFIGMACGFTSMIGNAAGPIFSIYLLAMGIMKNDYLGTTAWMFFLINLIKVPLQIFFWNNLSLKTAFLGIYMIPAIALGALAGILVIRKLDEKPFKYAVIGMTAIAAIKLFF